MRLACVPSFSQRHRFLRPRYVSLFLFLFSGRLRLISPCRAKAARGLLRVLSIIEVFLNRNRTTRAAEEASRSSCQKEIRSKCVWPYAYPPAQPHPYITALPRAYSSARLAPQLLSQSHPGVCTRFARLGDYGCAHRMHRAPRDAKNLVKNEYEPLAYPFTASRRRGSPFARTLHTPARALARPPFSSPQPFAFAAESAFVLGALPCVHQLRRSARCRMRLLPAMVTNLKNPSCTRARVASSCINRAGFVL
ncbi:hypothetical protein FB451DRAFT_44553 [Mycena latifolia]|nr:hypothetical protein FB451DRAFT_44553 [Mycena latifolia]